MEKINKDVIIHVTLLNNRQGLSVNTSTQKPKKTGTMADKISVTSVAQLMVLCPCSHSIFDNCTIINN